MHSARVAPLFVAALLVVSCERKPAAPAAQTSANPLRIITTDFAFSSPDTVPAGLTNIVMVNQGKDPHQAVVFRIDSNKTLAEVQAGLMGATIPTWITVFGGPNGAMPGDSAMTTTPLTPGNYMLVCFLNGADGKPHIAKGMIKSFVVTPAGTAMAMPAADITISTKDFAFEVSPAITAGTHTIRMVNNGPQLHEIAVMKLVPGATMAKVQAWMQSNMAGPPPLIPVGGIAGLSVGQTANFTATFGAGDYLLLCFVPDAKDGKPHVAHGMMMPFKIS
ncbi:MAG TPA: hypothetical protein VMC86_12350 [Gemmatimonadales bacterium]|nr:hypothetical protein [Gemmatimonadales bacterium]